jgi:hypothetical protein
MSEQNRQCSDTGCDKTSCESCDHANTAINFSAPLHEMSTVKKVIGIVSGKEVSENLSSLRFWLQPCRKRVRKLLF